ncbi:hypothetical protein LguiB_023130 [Lonicera macranthoides]
MSREVWLLDQVLPQKLLGIGQESREKPGMVAQVLPQLAMNPTIGLSLLFVEDDNENRGKKRKEDYRIAKSGGWSALDELMKEQEKAKEHSNRKDYWLREGIIVKVMSKVLSEKGYYKQKGIVHKINRTPINHPQPLSLSEELPRTPIFKYYPILVPLQKSYANQTINPLGGSDYEVSL